MTTNKITADAVDKVRNELRMVHDGNVPVSEFLIERVCGEAAAMLRDLWKELEDKENESEVFQGICEGLTESVKSLEAQLVAANEGAEKARKAVSEVRDLINETRGVDGWHRNEDIADWQECLTDETFDFIGAVKIP